MAQSKILVDTNSNLRLAQSVHPLLCVPFGDHRHIGDTPGQLAARYRHLFGTKPP